MIYERSKLYSLGQRIYTRKYITYFSTASISIGILLSIYAVRGYTATNACNTASGFSVSMNVTNTFRACFYVHFIEFVNCVFLGPILQVLLRTKVSHNERERNVLEAYAMVSYTLEMLLRINVFILIFWQLFMLNSKANQECFGSEEYL